MLHLGGGSLEAWRAAGYVGPLGADYRLILIDRRGQGESDKPRGISAHRIEEFRDDAFAVMDAAHIARSVFWGYSDGAKVGYAMADAAPGRIAGLIDHDGFEADLCESPGRENRLDFAKRLRASGVAKLLPRLAAREGVPETAPGFKILTEADSEMFALGVEAWAEWRGPFSVLSRLRVPLLMILSGQREAEGPEEFARVVELAGSRAKVVPMLGHLSLFLSPNRVIPLVRSFLRTLPISGAEAWASPVS
jgi:pimeloyl-ACP methyl ester carboxylesterase